MQLNHGKFHKYIGMTLDYTTVGQVKTTMLDYIDEVLDAFNKVNTTGGGTQSSNSPAILFNVKEDCIKLISKQAVDCHHLVAKIIYSTKRYRMDICTVI